MAQRPYRSSRLSLKLTSVGTWGDLDGAFPFNYPALKHTSVPLKYEPCPCTHLCKETLQC